MKKWCLCAFCFFTLFCATMSNKVVIAVDSDSEEVVASQSIDTTLSVSSQPESFDFNQLTPVEQDDDMSIVQSLSLAFDYVLGLNKTDSVHKTGFVVRYYSDLSEAPQSIHYNRGGYDGYIPRVATYQVASHDYVVYYAGVVFKQGNNQ